MIVVVDHSPAYTHRTFANVEISDVAECSIVGLYNRLSSEIQRNKDDNKHNEAATYLNVNISPNSLEHELTYGRNCKSQASNDS